jgi:hypothetical protein
MNGALFHWLLFGHLVGVAVLGGGLGVYVVGLHRLAAAGSIESLLAQDALLTWGERIALAGYGLLILSGVGLGLRISAFGEPWLLVSLVLLVGIAAAGRFSGVRLQRLLAAAPGPGAQAATVGATLRAAGSLAIHLPADATVVGIVELVYLMTLRPGAVGIIVSLGLSALVVTAAAIALVRARRIPEAVS